MSLKNRTVNVVCEKIVFPGRSLCRCEDGLALFADGLLCGETAEVFVTKDKKSFREGFVKNVVKKSLERIKPACSSFGFCGGCSFQNISYDNQIKFKQACVEELLNFTGTKISPVLQSPQIWNYRNKMEFSFFDSGGEADLGLHCKGSFNRYISVPPCFIADGSFLKAAEIVKNFARENKISAYNNKTHEGFFRHLVLRKAANNGGFLINIATNVVDSHPLFLDPLIKELSQISDSLYWTQNGKISDAVLSDKLTLMSGGSFITEKLSVGGRDYFFNISPFSFFQTNSKGTEILYSEILKLLDPLKKDVLLDLYCGAGTIGITIADRVKKVVGIEQAAQAVENAKENILLNNAANVEVYASAAEKWIKESGENFDSIIVDPPRNGLTKDIIEFLLNSKAEKIIYVSCNPSTLARDLRLIIESGKYKTEEIVPVDMFPQTYHIETIVLLRIL